VGNRVLLHSWRGRQTLAFDPINRMTAMSDPGNNLTTWLYDARDVVTRQENWNGTIATVAYDPRALITGLRHSKSDGSLLEQAQYLRDEVGNPTRRLTSGGTTDWVYDGARQLQAEWHEIGLIATWTYDGAGNRTRQERLQGGVRTVTDYEFDLAGELSKVTEGNAVTTVTADLNGNTRVEEMTNGSRTSYTWDARDRLTLAQLPSGVVAAYSYRFDNLRATVDQGGAEGTLKQVWDVPGFTGYGDLLEELTGADARQRTYYRGQLLATQQEQSQILVPGLDEMGSVLLFTDASQVVQGSYDYSAWGETLGGSGSATTPLGWLGDWGYYYDSSRRLWVRERHLDVGLGRWLSADPIGFPGGPNLYSYVGNRPTEYVDPDGLIAPVLVPWLIAGGTGAAFGGVVGGFRAYRRGARGWDLAKAVGRSALVGGAAGLVAFGAGELLALVGGSGLAAGLVRAAAGGMLGNAAGQGVEIGLGCRTEFDYWEFLAAGAIGIASFGLGRLPLWWARNYIAPNVRPFLLGLRPGPTTNMMPWFYMRPPRGLGLRPGTKVLLEQMPDDFLKAVEEPRAIHFTLEGISVRRFLQYARTQENRDQNWTNFEALHILQHPNLWPRTTLHNKRLIRW
jgi:RHS repeat-associated protein